MLKVRDFRQAKATKWIRLNEGWLQECELPAGSAKFNCYTISTNPAIKTSGHSSFCWSEDD